MNRENMIDVTEVNLVELVKAAYDLSRPQGLGILHFEEGFLTDEQAQELIDQTQSSSHAFALDYVKGRSVKLRARRDPENGKIFINKSWYDHSPDQMQELLKRAGL